MAAALGGGAIWELPVVVVVVVGTRSLPPASADMAMLLMRIFTCAPSARTATSSIPIAVDTNRTYSASCLDGFFCAVI